MSRGPYWMPDARWGARMGETKMVDPVMGGLTDPFHDIHMGVTAENLAERMAITPRGAGRVRGRVAPARRRGAARRAASTTRSCPVEVQGQARETVDFDARRARPRGRVAGVDGQAASRSSRRRRHRHRRQRVGHERRGRRGRADERARRPRSSARRCARGSSPTRRAAWTRRSWASARCRRCARRSSAPGVKLDDIDVIELNEAFAAQALAVMKDLDLDPGEGQPERRRDRARPPDRRDRRGDHRQGALRDGARATTSSAS